MEIKESGLTFTFSSSVDALKFDETSFYLKTFSHQPEGKGVDIMMNSPTCCQLIEIKNCTGHEPENYWRVFSNNSKVCKAPTNTLGEPRESLDIEVAKKVASTISCLYGAYIKSAQQKSASELTLWWEAISDCNIVSLKKSLLIVLFLEGDFKTRTRSKKMIMKDLQDSLKKKLSWLNCKVSVIDSSEYPKQYFIVK